MSARHVFGKNSVKALLDHAPERVFKIFISETAKPDKRLQAIQELARSAKISVQMVPRQKLDQMLQQESPSADTELGEFISHQGVAASVAPKALLDLTELLELCKPVTNPRLLMLDGITDPRNFGAILRVADAAGIQGVIVPKHNSAGFGPAVSKTASGAEETVNIGVVSNLNQAIETLKKAGFWIAGAANTPQAQDYTQPKYDMPVGLVMGSEDKGLSALTQKNCDFLIRIPMHGTVDSLNVAAATAVLIFEMIRSNK